MSNIEQAIQQLEQPDKGIGEALIEFYESMKILEKSERKGSLQADKIVMTINDIKALFEKVET